MEFTSRPSKNHRISTGLGTQRAAHSILAISPSDPNWVLLDKIVGAPVEKITISVDYTIKPFLSFIFFSSAAKLEAEIRLGQPRTNRHVLTRLLVAPIGLREEGWEAFGQQWDTLPEL